MASYVEKLYKCAPPDIDCSYSYEEFKSIGEFNVMDLSRLLTRVKDGLRSEEALLNEIQIFKVFIYKYESVFRNDKQLSALTQVRSRLKKVMVMQLPETVDKLNSSLKSVYKSSNVALKSERLLPFSGLKLPSKQRFQFAQVQIQAMGLLLVNTLKMICRAHKFTLYKVYLGHFIPITLSFLANLSRIWVLLRAYLKDCVDLYQRLLPLTKVLKGTETDWFPPSEKFPEDLSSWLELDLLECIKEDATNESVLEEEINEEEN